MNRDKVIKGLEACRKTDCINCPYSALGTEVCLIKYLLTDALALMKEQKSIIPWLSELMLNTNDEPIKPSEVIRRIEEGGLKRFAEEESQ